MDNKLVSIIVPIYNAEKYIDECITSIIHQSYTNLDIVLIDDGSADTSLSYLRKWESQDNRIRLFSQNNKGVSFTRNRGISLAKGDFLAFIDADDIIAPDFVEVLVDLLTTNKVDCAVCNILPFNHKSSIQFTNGCTHVINKEDATVQLLGPLKGYMANKMYKLDVIKSKSLLLNPDIAISEDLLFNFEYFQNIQRVAYNNGVKYFYRQYGESAFNNLSNNKWFSVLETMKILLSKVNKGSLFWKSISFTYAMLVYEAKYRLKYCIQVPESVNENIKNGENFISQYKSEFNLKQKCKIYLLKKIPSVVMLYKRRKIF